jgi:hypothetical protein
MPEQEMSFNPRRSRAVRVLRASLETGIANRAQLARAMGVTAADLDQFLAGKIPMPLDRQLLLASIVIEKAPAGSELARLGHRLQAQATAAMSFQSHETPTHRTAPALPYR